jgi:hypothetical protein
MTQQDSPFHGAGTGDADIVAALNPRPTTEAIRQLTEKHNMVIQVGMAESTHVRIGSEEADEPRAASCAEHR